MEVNLAKFKGMLEKHKDNLVAALPQHISAEKMIRVGISCVSSNPKLKECSAVSLFGALIQAAQLGLMPDNNLGECYLVPFSKRKAIIKECQLIIGYRGYIQLALRTKEVKKISARVVRKSDIFDYEYGTNEYIRHVPSSRYAPEDPMTYFYAIAQMDGCESFIVMHKEEIDLVKQGIKYLSDDSPWLTHYPEMGKKTAVRRLSKFLPLSSEILTAQKLDAMSDLGQSQRLAERVLEIQPIEEIFEAAQEELANTEKAEAIEKEQKLNETITEKRAQQASDALKEVKSRMKA